VAVLDEMKERARAQAQAELDARMSAVDQFAEASAQLEAARAAIAPLETARAVAYRRLVDSGWTSAQLRGLGITESGEAVKPKRPRAPKPAAE